MHSVRVNSTLNRQSPNPSRICMTAIVKWAVELSQYFWQVTMLADRRTLYTYGCKSNVQVGLLRRNFMLSYTYCMQPLKTGSCMLVATAVRSPRRQSTYILEISNFAAPFNWRTKEIWTFVFDMTIVTATLHEITRQCHASWDTSGTRERVPGLYSPVVFQFN